MTQDKSDRNNLTGPAPLASLAASLRGGTEAERLLAVAALGSPSADRAGMAALELLIEAMGDESYRVRKEAIGACLQWPDVMQVTERVVDALGEPDNVGRRNAAVEAVSKLGKIATAPLLRELSRHPEHRKVLIDVLSALGDEKAVPALRAALSDDNANVRTAAAEGLAGFDAAEAVPALLAVLTAGKEHELLVLLAALEGLNRHGVALSLDKLLPLLQRSVLRPAALLALGLSKDLAALPLLVEGLLDRGRGAREAAFCGLVCLHDGLSDASPAARASIESALSGLSELAVRSLIRALLEATPQARRAAALLLGWAGNKDAVRPLILALGDSSPEVSQAAGQSLCALFRVAVEPLCDLLPELDVGGRVAGFAFLARFGATLRPSLDEASRRRVRALLSDGLFDRDTAVAAAQALGWLGDAQALPPLLQAITDGDGDGDGGAGKAAATAAFRQLAREYPAESAALRPIEGLD